MLIFLVTCRKLGTEVDLVLRYLRGVCVMQTQDEPQTALTVDNDITVRYNLYLLLGASIALWSLIIWLLGIY